MAKLAALPDVSTIAALKGDIDFYYWKGIPVARAWPQHRKRTRSAAEVSSSQEFTAAAKITAAMAPQVKMAFQAVMNREIGLTWVDVSRSTARGAAPVGISG